MPGSTSSPDELFLAEFGRGQLSTRLWRGGLRTTASGYSCRKSARVLSNALKDGLDAHVSDGSVQSLIDEIETCWNDVERMRRACQVIDGAEANKSMVLSVSLAKLVLSIDVFQPHMVTCIVNKISEFGEESSGGDEIAKLLLNQLRWLDFIVDGPALCESLLSIVPVVCVSVQKAIIEALPEILDDSSQEAAVTELMRILQDSPAMMGSVVDALAALGVDNARLLDVTSSILSTLPAANRDVLPVSIRYVLRMSPPSLLSETVKALRHTLALPSLGPGPGRLCLDAVRSGLRMRKVMADQTVKVLRATEMPSDHRPSDFWILLALFDSPLHRKSAEIIFRKKATNGVFSNALIDAALAPFADAFGSLANVLIEMASIGVKSAEFGAQKTGILIYAKLFRLFPTGNTRRNVVMSLLEHTGTRQAKEVDAALQAFVEISKESEGDRSLLPHSASIQGLLDFLEFFSESQLRQIWTVLGFLCRASSPKVKVKTEQTIEDGRKGQSKTNQRGSENQQMADEDSRSESELAMLEILLRKELTHSDMFYRRIGVLGACTMVKVLGNIVPNNILTLLLEVGRTHPFSQALAFDELAEVFSTGDSASAETAEFIRKKISALFERKYVSDRAGLSTLVKDEELLPAELFGNLEGEDVEFCVSISHQVRNERTLQESQDAVRVMVPNLRLLCVMTAMRYKGSLSEIDAIIGAPLHLPLLPKDTDIAELPSQAKGDLLLSLFVAHGWTVELLNGFSEQESTELRAKCLKRVDDLLHLKSQISLCVAKIPLWKEVLFDAYHGTRAFQDNVQGVKARKTAKGSSSAHLTRSTKFAPNASSIRGDEWFSLSRQLSPSAFSLIRITNPVIWRFTETETEAAREGDPVTETVSLSSKGLHYLLSELVSYIEGLVRGETEDPTALGVVLFRPNSTGKHERFGDAMAEARLKKFNALRVSLISLGPQLSRCLKKLLPIEEDDLAENDATVDIYRTCAELCLRGLTAVLNSKFFHDAVAENLLFSVLASIRLDDSAPLEPSDPFTTEDIYVAAKEAFKQLRRTLKEIINIKSSASDDIERAGSIDEVGFYVCSGLLAVMHRVLSFCSDKEKASLGPQLSECAQWILGHAWQASVLRLKRTQKVVPGLVKIYVQTASNSFETLEQLREQVVKLADKSNAMEQKKEVATQDLTIPMSSSGSLASLTEQTFMAFTIAVLEQYMSLFKAFKPSTQRDPQEAFARIQAFIQAELPLYVLARQNHSLLGPVMRAGKGLVDTFLKSCLPFLKDKFRDHRSSVVQICKMHQKPTRILQTFCAHSKSIRDSSLTGLVPPLRKSLELLLYRVKELLESHNATNAFAVGNLKHRDINGQQIGSQQLEYENDSAAESEYESDEELDADNDENDSQVIAPESPVRKTKNKPPTAVSRSQGKRNGKRAKGVSPPSVTAPSEARSKKGTSAEERRPDLDFGSDGEHDASETEEEQVRRVRKKGSKGNVKRSKGSGSRSTKSRKRRMYDEIERDSRIHPLIDGEAAASDDEEEDEEDADMSQFIDFGDDEEDAE